MADERVLRDHTDSCGHPNTMTEIGTSAEVPLGPYFDADGARWMCNGYVSEVGYRKSCPGGREVRVRRVDAWDIREWVKRVDFPDYVWAEVDDEEVT